MRAHVWTHKYVPAPVGAALIQFCGRCGLRVESTIPRMLEDELHAKNLANPKIMHEDCDSVIVLQVMES